jgi:hypothetical protein
VLGSAEFEKQITERYQKANDKVIVFEETEVKEGMFEVRLSLPHDLKEDDYFLKATVLGEGETAVGSVGLRCSEAD